MFINCKRYDGIMAMINWQVIDKFILIILDGDQGRWAFLADQLRALGVPDDKIVRIETPSGESSACHRTQSHINAVEMAQTQGWHNAFIIEDDFCFNECESNYENINRFLNALSKIKWSVALFAANYYKVTPVKTVDYLVRVNVAGSACAYVVNKDYYTSLLTNYRCGLQALLQGKSEQEYALDVNWHTSMHRDLWLGIFPNSGSPFTDKSMNEKSDCCLQFNKPLHEIVSPAKLSSSPSGPIKVDFYFQWPPGWTNFESVIDAMRSNPAFDCRIVVVPYLNFNATDLRGDIQRGILKERSLDYIGFEDYSLESRQPDVVFLQNPYDEARPEAFRSEYLYQRGVKIAYIPYALDTGIGEETMVYQYNLLCQNLATWIFSRSERHRKEFASQCHVGNKHVYVTGHPKFDYYDRRYGLDEENKTKGKVKTFLWTPHFILPGNRKMYSTFNIYHAAIIKLIERDDVHVIIRPHPLLKQWLNVASQKTQDNYKKLVDISKIRNNVSWDFSHDYKSSFSQSDALIADMGSFLLEYLPSKKPILYLTHKTCYGLNKTADFIYDAYDVARNEKDIARFVENIVNERDPMRLKREKVLQEELQIDDVTVGEKITNIIYQSLRG